MRRGVRKRVEVEGRSLPGKGPPKQEFDKDHPEAIKKITDALVDSPGNRALFLSGSYANGMADAYSDIDFVLVATDAIAGQWRGAVALTGEIVLWWDRTSVPVLINAITAD